MVAGTVQQCPAPGPDRAGRAQRYTHRQRQQQRSLTTKTLARSPTAGPIPKQKPKKTPAVSDSIAGFSRRFSHAAVVGSANSVRNVLNLSLPLQRACVERYEERDILP